MMELGPEQQADLEKSDLSMPLVPKGAERLSAPMYAFVRRHFLLFDLFFFLLDLAKRADNVRFVAAEALAKIGDRESIERFERVKANREPAFEKVKTFSEIQSENILIRTTDNFLCFVSEILQACMLKRRELLRSDEKVALEEVMRFSRYSDLVSYLTDRKLNQLAYGGISGVADFVEQRLGITLTETREQHVLLNVSIELRNISTHNRGIVNDVFMSRVRKFEHGFNFKKGKRYHVDYDELVRMANNMYTIAARLDRSCTEKFKLRSKAYKVWQQGSKVRASDKQIAADRQGIQARKPNATT